MGITWKTSVLLVLQFAVSHSAQPLNHFVRRPNVPPFQNMQLPQQFPSQSSNCPLPPQSCPNGWPAVCTTSSTGYPTYFCPTGAYPPPSFPGRTPPHFGLKGSRSLLSLPQYQTDVSTPPQKVTSLDNSYPPGFPRPNSEGTQINGGSPMATKSVALDGRPPGSPFPSTLCQIGVLQHSCPCLSSLCYRPQTLQPMKPAGHDSLHTLPQNTVSDRSVENMFNSLKPLGGESTMLHPWAPQGYTSIGYNPHQHFPRPQSFSDSEHGLPIVGQSIPQGDRISGDSHPQLSVIPFQMSIPNFHPSSTQITANAPRPQSLPMGMLSKTPIVISGNPQAPSNLMYRETEPSMKGTSYGNAYPSNPAHAGPTIYKHYYGNSLVIPAPLKSSQKGLGALLFGPSQREQNTLPLKEGSPPASFPHQYRPLSGPQIIDGPGSPGYQPSHPAGSFPQDLAKLQQSLANPELQNGNQLPPSSGRPDSHPSAQLPPQPSQNLFSWIINSLRNRIPQVLLSNRGNERISPYGLQKTHEMGREAQGNFRHVSAIEPHTRPLPFLNSGLSLLSDDGEVPSADGQRSLGLESIGEERKRSRRKFHAKRGNHENKKHNKPKRLFSEFFNKV